MIKYLFTSIALIVSAQCFAANTPTEIGSISKPNGNYKMTYAAPYENLKEISIIEDAPITALACHHRRRLGV
jgi:hypothetical protein